MAPRYALLAAGLFLAAGASGSLAMEAAEPTTPLPTCERRYLEQFLGIADDAIPVPRGNGGECPVGYTPTHSMYAGNECSPIPRQLTGCPAPETIYPRRWRPREPRTDD